MEELINSIQTKLAREDPTYQIEQVQKQMKYFVKENDFQDLADEFKEFQAYLQTYDLDNIGDMKQDMADMVKNNTTFITKSDFYQRL